MIHLHKEGLFYVAYERSCYAFHRYIKPFKLSKRYVKSAGQEVVKLGFPSSGLEKLMEGRIYEHITDKRVAVTLKEEETIDETAFSEWKKNIEMQPPKITTVSAPQLQDAHKFESDRLIRMILTFPLESRTPMDCMNFVSELKRTIMNLQTP